MCWKCNTLNELFNQICVRNKTQDLNISMFNIITGINESKTLTRYISCEWKYKFDERKYIQINGGMAVNVDVSVKNVVYVKKIMFGFLLHVALKMGEYLESIMNGSVIMCHVKFWDFTMKKQKPVRNKL